MKSLKMQPTGWAGGLAVLLIGLLPLLSAAAGAAEMVPAPFVEGQSVRVIQGYNGGTHQAASRYGLDLVLAGVETSEALALSPFEGTVAWAFEPGVQTGCISVLRSDGRFSVMLCHVMLDRIYRRGERIARGQPLGVVGPAGTVGNNGTPHIHMELHVGGRSSSPVPFGAPDGLPLEGVDLPASGAANEHALVIVTSTNAISAPPVSLAPTPTLLSGTTQSTTRCAPGTSPRFVFGFADLKTRLGDAMGTPLTCEFPDPNGTGDVHQRTTKGLAFWRKSTNTPTFTNGYEHWGKTSVGWVYWVGESIDPPATATAV